MNSTFLQTFANSYQYRPVNLEASQNVQDLSVVKKYSSLTTETPMSAKEEGYSGTASDEILLTYGIQSHTDYHIASLLEDYISGEKDIPCLAKELNQSIIQLNYLTSK